MIKRQSPNGDNYAKDPHHRESPAATRRGNNHYLQAAFFQAAKFRAPESQESLQLRVQLMARRRRMLPRGSKSRSPSRNHRAQPRGRRFTRRTPRNFRCCLGLMCESPWKVWGPAVNLDRLALSQFGKRAYQITILVCNSHAKEFSYTLSMRSGFLDFRSKFAKNRGVSQAKIAVRPKP
jgi:hypothetical protein